MEHIGKQIGKYTITRLIGEGGMASVYEGVHEILETKAAIKILNPILSSNKQIRERFKNEARIMASLDHPNITRVLDYDESDSYLAIAMELLTGEDLSKRIKNKGKLPEEEIKHIFEQILTAFQYAHAMGIVHRDIKPSNIFILPNGVVKILDFGIAKLFGQGNEMTQTGMQMGTPVYMSPEQVKADKSIDHRSDIYSLGVTLFYALSGKPPYDINIMSQFDIFTKIVFEQLPVSESTSFLAELVKKACQKDREQRFQSCDEWLKYLKQGVMTKSEAHSSEKTFLEAISSDKTVFESPKSEKTVLEQLFDEKTTIEQVSQQTNLKEQKLKILGIVDSLIVHFNKQFYKTVVIGNQTWMAENLNVDKFRNGDSIPEVKTYLEWKQAGKQGKPAWCYYNNDSVNGVKYGKLYNWYAVNDPRGLAPEGWHVPSDKEWKMLSDFIDGEKGVGKKSLKVLNDFFKGVKGVGKKLKSTSGWHDTDGYSHGNGTNEIGFRGLPGGLRYEAFWGDFKAKTNNGYWWSNSEYFWNDAIHYYLSYDSDNLFRSPYDKKGGLSVRCIKD